MPDRASLATILVHATDPASADDALAAVIDLNLDEIRDVDRVVTAYDLIVIVEFPNETRLAAIVHALQALEPVARTLTLVHVPDPEEDDDA